MKPVLFAALISCFSVAAYAACTDSQQQCVIYKKRQCCNRRRLYGQQVPKCRCASVEMEAEKRQRRNR